MSEQTITLNEGRTHKPAHPSAIRWARITFADGTHKDVLQQSFVSEWTQRDGNSTRCGVDVEWRDVPLWFVQYEPPR